MNISKVRIFRSIILLILPLLTSFLLISCSQKNEIEESVRFEWDYGYESHLMTYSSPGYKLTDSINLSQNKEHYDIAFSGQKPRIFFEYTRSDYFIFEEILVERIESNEQHVVKTGNNLDGYTLSLGGSTNNLSGLTSVRGILEVPHISYLNEKYVLLSIKIINSNNKIETIELEDSEYIVEVALDESHIINYINDTLQQLRVNEMYNNKYEIIIEDFFERFRFSDIEIINIFMGENEISSYGLNGDLILRYPNKDEIHLGDYNLYFQFEFNLSKSFKDFSNILDIKYFIQIIYPSELLNDAAFLDYNFQEDIGQLELHFNEEKDGKTIFINELFNGNILKEVYVEIGPTKEATIVLSDDVDVLGDLKNLNIIYKNK